MRYRLYYIPPNPDGWGIGLSSSSKLIITYPASIHPNKIEVFANFTNNQWMTFFTNEYHSQADFIKESVSIEELKQYCIENYFEYFL